MNLSRREWFAALASCAAGRLVAQTPTAAESTANGQNPQPAQTEFSTGVNVVNVFATVRDKKGQIVRDLTAQDFSIEEDDKPQAIRYFSAESNLPLTLGLLIDTSPSQRRVLKDEQDASYRFFDRVLREDRDQAFVIHFDAEVELLQDLTPSREKLEKALDQLQIGVDRSSGGRGGNQGGNSGGYPGGQYPRRGGGYPGGGGRRGGGTDLYDAILLASDDVTKNQKGRKAIVLLTDGVDTGSKTTLFRAIQSAQKADTLVYAVLFADANGNGRPPIGFGGPGMGRHGGRGGGMGYPRPGGGDEHEDGKKVLEQIARETGGRFFQVNSKMPIEKVYSEIQEDLRNQYSIGYTSDQPPGGGAYRHIRLQAKKKDLLVQAREGYYANP